VCTRPHTHTHTGHAKRDFEVLRIINKKKINYIRSNNIGLICNIQITNK